MQAVETAELRGALSAAGMEVSWSRHEMYVASNVWIGQRVAYMCRRWRRLRPRGRA